MCFERSHDPNIFGLKLPIADLYLTGEKKKSSAYTAKINTAIIDTTTITVTVAITLTAPTTAINTNILEKYVSICLINRL